MSNPVLREQCYTLIEIKENRNGFISICTYSSEIPNEKTYCQTSVDGNRNKQLLVSRIPNVSERLFKKTDG